MTGDRVDTFSSAVSSGAARSEEPDVLVAGASPGPPPPNCFWKASAVMGASWAARTHSGSSERERRSYTRIYGAGVHGMLLADKDKHGGAYGSAPTQRHTASEISSLPRRRVSSRQVANLALRSATRDVQAVRRKGERGDGAAVGHDSAHDSVACGIVEEHLAVRRSRDK
eukprot:scaffold25714_cov30-Tisochrysis_lutea.AAC.3